MSVVIGIDPSLTGLGISDGEQHWRIVTAPPASLSERVHYLTQRVALFVSQFHPHARAIMFVVEAAMLTPGANHLREIGWLECRLDLYFTQLRKFGIDVTAIEVPNSTLKKFATGKGNTPTSELPVKALKKWGIEIENDPKHDKLIAYLLHRYGRAIIDGEITHQPSARRGQGQKETANRRAAARTRGVA